MTSKISPNILDLNDVREIEFTMISETNFEKLELLEKDETAIEEQVYEDVDGFEDLKSKVQTRTTAFSCKKEKEDYDESFLMSRPLPWVVRVYFKMEDSMKGILCSGKGTLFHQYVPSYYMIHILYASKPSTLSQLFFSNYHR